LAVLTVPRINVTAPGPTNSGAVSSGGIMSIDLPQRRPCPLYALRRGRFGPLRGLLLSQLKRLEFAVMLDRTSLLEVVSYDPETGIFRWRVSVGRAAAGMRAGANKAGYRRIKIDGRDYFEHQLAWLYVHGVWPLMHIDHVNRDKSDNRLCNLRLATMTQNQGNAGARRDNKLGVKGVDYREKWGKWQARIHKQGKTHRLGSFDTPEEASAAYLAAAQEHFGKAFART
jgi:hypothetical protein